nr:hypothetical protein [Tanacetum cinerariifolium]
MDIKLQERTMSSHKSPSMKRLLLSLIRCLQQ